tara:strand:+ start:141 stop:368 length:228 start_codon:yes stop_codon:yes gene_type:complete
MTEVFTTTTQTFRPARTISMVTRTSRENVGILTSVIAWIVGLKKIENPVLLFGGGVIDNPALEKDQEIAKSGDFC